MLERNPRLTLRCCALVLAVCAAAASKTPSEAVQAVFEHHVTPRARRATGDEWRHEQLYTPEVRVLGGLVGLHADIV